MPKSATGNGEDGNGNGDNNDNDADAGIRWVVHGTKVGDLDISLDRRKWGKPVTIIARVQEPRALARTLAKRLGTNGTVRGNQACQINK